MAASSLKQLIKGSFWILIANLFTRFSGFIVLPIIARLLGPSGLGIYSVIQQTIQTADVLSRVGLDLAIHRNGAQYETLGVERTGRTFGVGGLLIAVTGAFLAIGLANFPNFIAVNLLGDPQTETWLRIASYAIFFTAIATPSWIYLMAVHAFRAYSLRTTLVTILGAILTLVFTFKFGLAGAVWGLALGALGQSIVGWWLTLPILQEKAIKLRLDRFIPESMSLLKLGLPFYTSNFLAGFVALPFLGYITKLSGVEQVGYIRIAQSLSQFISFLPVAIAPVLVSTLSASLGADRANHTKTKSLHFRVTWLIVIILSLVICLGLDIIVPLLFGKRYLESIPLARIAVYGTALSTMAGVLNQYLVAEAKTKIIGIVQTISLLLNILLAVILIPLYSALGLLIAQAIASGFTLFYLARPAINDILATHSVNLRSMILLSAIASVIILGLPTISTFVWLKPIGSIIVIALISGFSLWQTFSSDELKSGWEAIKTKLSKLGLN
jgi:O-antigen/teichoic acid export membrane protein